MRTESVKMADDTESEIPRKKIKLEEETSSLESQRPSTDDSKASTSKQSLEQDELKYYASGLRCFGSSDASKGLEARNNNASELTVASTELTEEPGENKTDEEQDKASRGDGDATGEKSAEKVPGKTETDDKVTEKKDEAGKMSGKESEPIDVDDLPDDSDSDSDLSVISDLSDLSGEDRWKAAPGGASEWVFRSMEEGEDPRTILRQILPDETMIPNVDNLTLWKIVLSIVSEPPPRNKLSTVNTFSDVVKLIKECKKIMVLTGAGVSVSCGIPDFRSRNGIYARLAVDFPDLPDPQAMFDIRYFRRDQRPFFKFAKEIYPGQFEPSKSHKFVAMLEQHRKLLRNYTQNIDTLEQVAGIRNVIQCHGSFATATCMACSHKCSGDDIKSQILAQVIPTCPKCDPATPLSVMKPDIVFFGESLPEEFHELMTYDKDRCDLLIVIGSSLKVRPVALIPNSLPSHVPQILINKEPLRNLNFDVELLGDCEIIISELCRKLGDEWGSLANKHNPLQEILVHELLTPPTTPDPLLDKPPPWMTSPTAGAKRIDKQTNASSAGPSTSSDKPPESTTESSGGKAPVEETKIDTVCSSEGAIEKSMKPDCDSSEKTEHIDKQNTDVVDDSQKQCDKDKEQLPGSGSTDLSGKSKDAIAASTSKENEKTEQEKEDASKSIVEDKNGSKEEDKSTGKVNGEKPDAILPGPSTNVEELRKMWKPSRYSVARRLGPNQYCFVPPNRYIFNEAEVFTVIDSDSDEDDCLQAEPSGLVGSDMMDSDDEDLLRSPESGGDVIDLVSDEETVKKSASGVSASSTDPSKGGDGDNPIELDPDSSPIKGREEMEVVVNETADTVRKVVDVNEEKSLECQSDNAGEEDVNKDSAVEKSETDEKDMAAESGDNSGTDSMYNFPKGDKLEKDEGVGSDTADRSND